MESSSWGLVYSATCNLHEIVYAGLKVARSNVQSVVYDVYYTTSKRIASDLDLTFSVRM